MREVTATASARKQTRSVQQPSPVQVTESDKVAGRLAEKVAETVAETVAVTVAVTVAEWRQIE